MIQRDLLYLQIKENCGILGIFGKSISYGDNLCRLTNGMKLNTIYLALFYSRLSNYPGSGPNLILKFKYKRQKMNFFSKSNIRDGSLIGRHTMLGT